MPAWDEQTPVKHKQRATWVLYKAEHSKRKLIHLVHQNTYKDITQSMGTTKNQYKTNHQNERQHNNQSQTSTQQHKSNVGQVLNLHREWPQKWVQTPISNYLNENPCKKKIIKNPHNSSLHSFHSWA